MDTENEIEEFLTGSRRYVGNDGRLGCLVHVHVSDVLAVKSDLVVQLICDLERWKENYSRIIVEL